MNDKVASKYRAGWLALFGLMIWAAPSRAGVDAEQFFRRLESVGLSTTKLRKVAAKISLKWYRKTDGVAAAVYDYKLNSLKLPIEFKDGAQDRIKFDLDPTALDTCTHEFCHAEDDLSDDLFKAGDTLDDADGQMKENALAAIQTDLLSQERHGKDVAPPELDTEAHRGRLAEARKRAHEKEMPITHLKTWEIAGYFVGAGINDVFFNAHAIVSYNLRAENYMKTAADIAKYKDSEELLIPDYLKDAKLGLAKNDNDAYFVGKVIPYNRKGREKIFLTLWDHALGLRPPHSNKELLEKLNSPGLANDWIKDVRARVKAARARITEPAPAAPAAPAANAGAPGRADGDVDLLGVAAAE